MTDTKEHIPSLDGLRGFAAMLVFFAHAAERLFVPTFWTHALGPVGITLFFTLSGFLMSYLYMRQKINQETVSRYITSRFSRIAPAYLFVIAVSFLVATFIDPDFVYNINTQNLARHLLFSGGVSVFWSIPPEVQFYVFFLCLWWAGSHVQKRSYIPALLVSLMSILMLLYVTEAPGTTLPSKLHFFLLGAGGGWIRSRYPKAPFLPVTVSLIQLILLVCMAAYAVFLGYSVLNWGSPYRFSDEIYYMSSIYTLFCAAVVFSCSYTSAFSNFLFANKSFRLLGAWSFSFYLLHEPFLQLMERWTDAENIPVAVSLVVGLAVSLVLSVIMHHVLERPAQRAIKAARFALLHRTR